MANQTKGRQVIKNILQVAAVGGILATALIAPNVIGAALKLNQQYRLLTNHRYYLKGVAGRLADRGLISLAKNHRGQTVLRLTAKGQAELERYEVGDLTISKPRKWDGQYRLIIFDIKEGKRDIRDRLREWLVSLGFVRLQNSVWVHPYECQEVVTLLKSHFKIGKEVLYITATSIENDAWLRRHFQLS